MYEDENHRHRLKLQSRLLTRRQKKNKSDTSTGGAPVEYTRHLAGVQAKFAVQSKKNQAARAMVPEIHAAETEHESEAYHRWPEEHVLGSPVVRSSVGFQDSSSSSSSQPAAAAAATTASRGRSSVKEEVCMQAGQRPQQQTQSQSVAAESADNEALEQVSSLTAPMGATTPAPSEHQEGIDGIRPSMSIEAVHVINDQRLPGVPIPTRVDVDDQHGTQKHVVTQDTQCAFVQSGWCMRRTTALGAHAVESTSASSCTAGAVKEEGTLTDLECPKQKSTQTGSRWRRSWRRPTASGPFEEQKEQPPAYQLHESYDDGWSSDTTGEKKTIKVKKEPGRDTNKVSQTPGVQQQQTSSSIITTVSTAAGVCAKKEIKPEQAVDDGGESAQSSSWACRFCTFVNENPSRLKREGSRVGAHSKSTGIPHRKSKSSESKCCLRQLPTCDVCGLHNLTAATSQQELEGLRVVELKALLRALKLSHTGKKKELIARLLVATDSREKEEKKRIDDLETVI